MSKYKAVKTTIDGITFASKHEANRYSELKLLERAGIITDLELQPKYTLYAKVKYIADFRYIENGKTVVEDAKGFKTDVYKIKKKMFLELYPHIDFREV